MVKGARSVSIIVVPLLLLYLFAVVSPLRLGLDQDQTLVLAGMTFFVVLGLLAVRIVGFSKIVDRRYVQDLFLSLKEVGFHSIFFSIDRLLPSPGFHSYWGNYPQIGQSDVTISISIGSPD
jgi:hypothetical protein